MTVGASVILENNENQILLIHRRDNDLWGLPAGSTEINESPLDTAIREVEEETEIQLDRNDLNLMQVFGGEDFFYVYPNGDQCSNVVISYTAKIREQVAKKETFETKDAVWFNRSKLPTNIATHELIILEYFFSEKRKNL